MKKIIILVAGVIIFLLAMSQKKDTVRVVNTVQDTVKIDSTTIKLNKSITKLDSIIHELKKKQ